MCLFASSVDRPDVHDLFRGRVCKPAPYEAGQTERNQNYPNCSVHDSLSTSLPKNFFDLSDLLPELPGELFVLAFRRQLWVIRSFPFLLFRGASRLVKFAFENKGRV